MPPGSSGPPSQEPAPTSLGKYQLLRQLAVGGMAELWLGALRGPGGFTKLVALKRILPQAAGDARFVKMFIDEARITAALAHPNIGQVFELDAESEGQLFLAMEFVAGQNLEHVAALARSQRRFVPLPIACRVVHDAALGLHSAHTFCDPATGAASPVVHRDVAPKNIMVTYDGRTKVIDFGIAKARGRLTDTHAGTVKGTVGYMSPEQVRDRPLDGRSDLFSLGIVLYELVTGVELFAADKWADAMHRIVVEAIPAPERPGETVPPALVAALAKALEKDPAARWQTARDFARAIEIAVPLAEEEDVARWLQMAFPAELGQQRALAEAMRGEDLEAVRKSLAVMALPDAHRAESRPAAWGWWLGAAVLAAGVAVALVLLNDASLAPPPPTPPDWPLGASKPLKPPKPPDRDAMALEALARGELALEQERWSEAIDYFSAVLHDVPGHFGAKSGRALSQAMTGVDLDVATQDALDVTMRSEGDANAWMALAVASLASERTEDSRNQAPIRRALETYRRLAPRGRYIASCRALLDDPMIIRSPDTYLRLAVTELNADRVGMARALLHSCTLAAKPTRCQSHQMLLKQMNDEEPLRRRIDQLEQQRKSGICDGPSPPPEHLSLYGERLARVLALPCTPAKPDGSTPMP